MIRFVDHSTLTGRAVRYGITGVAVTLLYYLAVALLVELGQVRPAVSAALATSVLAIAQYVANRLWIFPTDRSHVSAFSRYVTASALGIALNTGLMYVAVDCLQWKYWAGLLLATLVVPPTNFLINNYWTFRARGVPGD